MQWRIMKRLEEKLKPTDPALAWEKKNEWFGSKDHHNIEATRIAFATHEYLCALCYVEIDSDEYSFKYSFLCINDDTKKFIFW